MKHDNPQPHRDLVDRYGEVLERVASLSAPWPVDLLPAPLVRLKLALVAVARDEKSQGRAEQIGALRVGYSQLAHFVADKDQAAEDRADDKGQQGGQGQPGRPGVRAGQVGQPHGQAEHGEGDDLGYTLQFFLRIRPSLHTHAPHEHAEHVAGTEE